MTLIICDDLPEDREVLRTFLREYATEQHLEFDVLEYTSAEELLQELPSLSEEPDIIFLDIYMGETTGMEAAYRLLDDGYHGAFIFATTSPDHMQAGFRIHAAEYFLKPFSYQAFRGAMGWCEEYLQKAKKTISFVSERLDMTIYLSDITYIEAYLKTSVIHARDRQLTTYKNFTQFEAELADQPAFLRIDRGLLVNFGSIERWDEEFIYFKNKERLALPVRNRKNVLQQIEDCYWLKIAESSKRLRR